MTLLSVFKPVMAVYYRLDVPPEKIRKTFPGMMEFVNPSESSFEALRDGLNGGSVLLIVDVWNGPRHVFIQPLRPEKVVVVIEESKPRVFLFSPKNAADFFSYLARDELGELERISHSYSKGNPLRFVLDLIVISIASAISTYFDLGIWPTALIGAIMALTVVFIEKTFGPGKKTVTVHVLPESALEKGLKKAEKKGRVKRVTI
jgi:hypothetical protein